MVKAKLKLAILEQFGCQADFAQAVNVHESDVSRVVRGRKTLSVEARKRWAAVLGRSPQELFDEE